MKYLFIAAIAVSVWCYYLNWRVDSLEEDNKRLEAENKSLVSDIERRDKNDLEKSERQKEAAKLAEKDNFDWSYDIGGSPLIVRLRQECKSCSPKTDKLY